MPPVALRSTSRSQLAKVIDVKKSTRIAFLVVGMIGVFVLLNIAAFAQAERSVATHFYASSPPNVQWGKPSRDGFSLGLPALVVGKMGMAIPVPVAIQNASDHILCLDFVAPGIGFNVSRSDGSILPQRDFAITGGECTNCPGPARFAPGHVIVFDRDLNDFYDFSRGEYVVSVYYRPQIGSDVSQLGEVLTGTFRLTVGR